MIWRFARASAQPSDDRVGLQSPLLPRRIGVEQRAQDTSALSVETDPGFAPVSTVTDLNTLDEDEIVEGYRTTQRGDPEPGPNRGRAFWHGWRNRMVDYGEIPHDDASRRLVHEYLAAERQKRASSDGGA